MPSAAAGPTVAVTCFVVISDCHDPGEVFVEAAQMYLDWFASLGRQSLLGLANTQACRDTLPIVRDVVPAKPRLSQYQTRK